MSLRSNWRKEEPDKQCPSSTESLHTFEKVKWATVSSNSENIERILKDDRQRIRHEDEGREEQHEYLRAHTPYHTPPTHVRVTHKMGPIGVGYQSTAMSHSDAPC